MYILKKYILYVFTPGQDSLPDTLQFLFAVIQTVLSGRFEVCLNLIEYNNSAGILPHNYESTEQSRENT